MHRLPRTARWVKTYKNIGFAFLTLASSCVLCLPARAASHALIMWIGQYADPRANLPGIELDAKAARQIALTMGVPTDNISELKNGELTLQMMSQAIAGLVNRIAPGDKVFLYYSGHGNQLVNVSGNGRKCSEGMVSHDLQLYFDRDLEADLSKLGSKASQVVMMNDSCFSGGGSTKSFSRLVAKALPVPLRKAGAGGAASAAADYNCGDAVNKSLAKNLEVIPRGGARLLYIAAAADNEVASASPEGSLATQAWAACLKDPAADTNHSGTINGDELRACAQARIDANKLGVRQHVTLTGTTTLPVSFADTSTANDATRVVPNRALLDIQAGSDKSYQVSLKPAKTKLVIGTDNLEFDVQINRDGYLYLFQIGSDGSTINVLFPNSVDDDNHMKAGAYKFPRPAWALKAMGPKGTDHLMALLSDEPKSYADIAKKAGIFSSVPATRRNVKTLVVVSTGAAAGKRGRYGTSEVVQVTEGP